MSDKPKLAAKMIEEAVLVEKNRSSNEGLSRANAVHLMSSHVGTELTFLLTDENDEDRYSAWQDWGRSAGDFKDLAKHLLVLLTVPANVESLPYNLKNSAGEMLLKLHDFFDCLTGKFTYTEEWLTWTRLIDYPEHNKEVTLDSLIKHYNLDNRKSSENYFYRKGIDSIEEMKKIQPAVRSFLNSVEDSE